MSADSPVRTPPPSPLPAARLAHLTLLVESAVGYRNLCRLLTAAHAHTRDNTGRTAGQPAVELAQLEEHADGLVCLSGCARRGSGWCVGAGVTRAARRHSPIASWRSSAASASGSSCSVPTGATTAPATAGSPGSPSGSACPASRPATCTRTAAAGRFSRTPSSPCGWGRRWRRASRGAAATRPRRWPRRGAWRSASPSTRRRSPRPCGSPSASASTSQRSSATATPARRTPAPIASWLRSAPRGWPSATPAWRAAAKPKRDWRPSWRRSASSASPASSSSTATCSSWPARSRSRCAGRSRRAPSCRRAGGAAPASARSSAT